jgi:hypothetical protein
MAMVQSSSQSQPRKKDDILMFSLDGLRQALATETSGREREWLEAVGDALARIEVALRQHRVAAQAPDGPLAEVDQTRPTLARQADALRSDHDDFLMQLLALREQVRRAVEAFQSGPASPASASRGVDLGAIRQQAEQLLAGLQENREAETKLVQESINTDIGAGD